MTLQNELNDIQSKALLLILLPSLTTSMATYYFTTNYKLSLIVAIITGVLILVLPTLIWDIMYDEKLQNTIYKIFHFLNIIPTIKAISADTWSINNRIIQADNYSDYKVQLTSDNNKITMWIVNNALDYGCCRRHNTYPLYK